MIAKCKKCDNISKSIHEAVLHTEKGCKEVKVHAST